jgi:putative zinc finger/helix-turn-helix YgiT family protein
MICIKCENEVFAEKPNAIIEQEFRGEKLKVRMTASACTKCGWTTLTLRQTDELRRLAADAYRRKHGLLTSEQIKAIRNLKGMSQRDFAAFLGVGEASVKRWETWLAQENSSDQLVRAKCVVEIAQLELADSLMESLVTQKWTQMASVHAALLNAYAAAGQSAPTQIPHPAKRTRPGGTFLPDYDTEKESCISCAANEELALAA